MARTTVTKSAVSTVSFTSGPPWERPDQPAKGRHRKASHCVRTPKFDRGKRVTVECPDHRGSSTPSTGRGVRCSSRRGLCSGLLAIVRSPALLSVTGDRIVKAAFVATHQGGRPSPPWRRGRVRHISTFRRPRGIWAFGAGRLPMIGELADTYRAYLDCLNRQAWGRTMRATGSSTKRCSGGSGFAASASFTGHHMLSVNSSISAIARSRQIAAPSTTVERGQ